MTVKTEDTAPTDTAADMLAAMDVGIASVSEAPVVVVEPVVEPVVEAPAEAPVPGTPEALAAEEAAAAAAKEVPPVAGDKPAGDKPEVPERDAAVEAEITGLNLKDKAAERFRSLTAEVKELAPVREVLKAAGITDVAELPAMLERAKHHDEWVGMVLDTGASNEQYGAMLDYLTLGTRAAGGDMAAARQAYDQAKAGYEQWAKILAIEVPGVNDPLAEHPDLQAEVEAGDITRTRALETAALRQHSKVQESVRERQSQAQRQTQEQTKAAETAADNGRQALNALGADLAASDPDYAAKVPLLLPQLAKIKAEHPPEKWEALTALAYAKIRLPVAPVPEVKQPLPGPLRPGGPRPSLAPAVFDDEMDAMDYGIAQASGTAGA